MGKTTLALLVLVVSACQTGAFEPIEIDLSKRTTAATTPAPTPTPLPASEVATGVPVPAPSPSHSPASSESAWPEQVVEAQLAAYNRHDVEAFLNEYAAGAVLYDFADRVLQSGTEEIRQRYATVFAESPEGRVTVSSRIVQGDFVIDHETVTGLPTGRSLTAVVIYEIHARKIQRVWFIR
jgi:hypothetical protein